MIRLSRKKKEEDDGKGKYYTHAQHVPVAEFKGLKTEVAKEKWKNQITIHNTFGIVNKTSIYSHIRNN